MARQPCDQGPARASVMAPTVLAIRRARPAVSAMSSQSFETSMPMQRGPAATDRSVEASPREVTMGVPFARRGGPLALDCKLGVGPTYRSRSRPQRQDDGSRLLANSYSIQNRSRRPAPPSLPQKQSRKRPARQNVQSRGTLGARRSPGLLRFARNDGSM